MTDIKQILIVDSPSKLRLDNFLATNLDGWTRSQIKKQIDDGRVLVNQKPVVKAGFVVKNGDAVSVDLIATPDLSNVLAEDIPIDIVYEDNDLAVINKPQGMVVHPAPGNPNHTLVNALLYHFNALSNSGEAFRPGIVHRIDKNTSGLLVVAKNNEAHLGLAEQISKHTCARTYLALTEGEFKNMEGEVIAPIGHDPKDYKKMAIVPDGKYAETHYRVVALFNGFSLVEFKLKTGRTHQIRVHAKSLGHPIVGDDVYGPKAQKFNLAGQLLHAAKLELTHPKTGKKLTFTAPIPDYFESVMQKLTLKWPQSLDYNLLIE